MSEIGQAGSQVLVGDSRELKIARVCLWCTRVARVATRHPRTVLSWDDEPLPEGWAWAVTNIGADEPDTVTPICNQCVKLHNLRVDKFWARHAEARDIHFIAPPKVE